MLNIVRQILERFSVPGWLVGGSVRDMELGRPSPDLDVVVLPGQGGPDPRRLAREVARELDLPWFVLSERFPAYRVLGRGAYLDISAVRGGSIEADLSLRDFTCNAMALSLDRDDLVDPYGGRDHVRRHMLVPVSDRIFEDDPLRLLRAVRFCHVLDFALDAVLERLVRGQASLVARAAPERILSELASTLEAGRSAAAAALLARLGLLAALFPGLAWIRAGGAAGHTLEHLSRLDDLLAGADRWPPETGARMHERLLQPVDGVLSRPVALRLVALLLGPRPAQDYAQDDFRRGGRSADSLTATAEVLRLSAAAQDLLLKACRAAVNARRISLPPTRRETVLFLWDTFPWEPEILVLLDAIGVADASVVSLLMQAWSERAKAGVSAPPVDGNDLMEALSLPPGPALGQVVREIRLGWEAGEMDTKEEALRVAQEVLAGLESSLTTAGPATGKAGRGVVS